MSSQIVCEVISVAKNILGSVGRYDVRTHVDTFLPVDFSLGEVWWNCSQKGKVRGRGDGRGVVHGEEAKEEHPLHNQGLQMGCGKTG